MLYCIINKTLFLNSAEPELEGRECMPERVPAPAWPSVEPAPEPSAEP